LRTHLDRTFVARFSARTRASVAGALAAIALVAGAPQPASAADSDARWDLSDLYATPDAWTQAYDRVRATIGTLDRYKGTLGTSAESMLAALSAISDTRREVLRLFVYATLRSDEDVRVAPNLERRQMAGSLFTQMSERTAWLAPEIQALGETKVKAFIAAAPELKRRFDFALDNTLRLAPHTLGLEGESLLASTGDVLAQPYAVWQQLISAEIPYAKIEIDGKTVTLDDPAYEKYRQVDSRADRKRVFDAFFGAMKSFQGTIGANLTTQVMADVFNARARKYPNSLDAALFGPNMPERVYRTLVAQANAGLPTLHRYLRLRKRILGVTDDLAYYDNYRALFRLEPAPVFTLEDSQKITLAALAPLGDEYLALLKRGFAAKWSDAHPRPGKATGGYMFGAAYDVHPYLLLNHNDDYMSLSVVAHEWGHAVHTMLTVRAQPFEKSGYSTFIAESASIGNELLLNDYMVRTAKTREQKLFYLSQQLEQIRTTYFRQVQFAEFQLAIHEARERGEALSGASMTETYCKLLRRYYGEAEGVMKIDPLYCTEWAYISHMYRGFYVWQYATSLVGGVQLTEDIQRNGAAGRDRFLQLLKAGGSDYAYDLYKRAGVDLGEPGPYQALIRRMERVMDEIEALAGAR
jgi:oligoendopeptidase F